MYDKLFTKGKINGCVIPNRIVLAPMDDCLGQTSGEISQRGIEYYTRKAQGGCGLIIIGYVGVSSSKLGGVAMSGQTFLRNIEQRHAISNVAERIHDYGSRVFVQLNHPGRKTNPKFNDGYSPVSATALPTQLTERGFSVCHELSVAEIHEIEDDFANAAEHAYLAGIDGVELHCAHWYLLHQFISPVRNERTDEYGGSMENRCRIVTEIIQKIRSKVPKTFPVTVRMHFFDDEQFHYDLSIEDYVEIAKYFEKNGVDAIHFSIGTEDRTGAPDMKAGWRNKYYKIFKNALNIPIYGPNEVKTPEEAEAILEDDVYDYVVMGRPQSADPDWGKKAKAGHSEDIRPCLNCNFCVYHVTADQYQIRCSVNPTLGREIDALHPVSKGEGTVAVIGGGPAGIQAAMTLSDRGYKVVLFEAREELGGSLNLANKAPGKFRMDNLIRYYRHQVEKRPSIQVCLNAKIDENNLEEIKKLHPYAVILAAGGNQIIPKSIPGIEKGIPCNDILSGKKVIKDSEVVVVGGGMSGLETAEVLAEKGNKVTIVEMAPIVGNGIYFYNVRKTRRGLEEKGTVIKTSTALQEIKDGAVVVAPHNAAFISEAMKGVANIAGVADAIEEDEHKGPYEIKTDATVLALGVAQNMALEENLETICDNVIAIGDCTKPGKIADATSAAYWRCRNL